MELSARLYNCARCYCLTIICSACDRNNIYCGSICSSAARTQSCYLAGQLYQRTLCGRQKHAERQRRYRERLRKKVTHHSSPTLPPHVVLPRQPNVQKIEVMSGHYHCHFCGKSCSPLLRRGYLRNARHHSPSRSSSWPLAP